MVGQFSMPIDRRAVFILSASFAAIVADFCQLAAAHGAGVQPFRVAGIGCPFERFKPENFPLHFLVVLHFKHFISPSGKAEGWARSTMLHVSVVTINFFLWKFYSII
jgi:hypothetical protein